MLVKNTFDILREITSEKNKRKRMKQIKKKMIHRRTNALGSWSSSSEYLKCFPP